MIPLSVHRDFQGLKEQSDLQERRYDSAKFITLHALFFAKQTEVRKKNPTLPAC